MSDSDSYTKWGATLAAALPEGWVSELALLETDVLPSERQLRAALAGTRWAVAAPRRVQLDALTDLVREFGPDAVLLAFRGPLVRVAAGALQALSDRPVLIAGFPGLTIPAVPKAIIYREQVDLVILHSRREVREFRRLAGDLPGAPRFGLATLPFLPTRADVSPARHSSADADRTGTGTAERARHAVRAHPASTTNASPANATSPAGEEDDADSADAGASGWPSAASATGRAETGDVVFAVQAKVPASREERVHLVGVLAEAARRQPRRRFVVKVRARAGEAQTHAETFDLGELVRDPAVARELGFTLPPNLVVEDGPMSAHLARAAALVTVSSTAVLEAIAAGVPALLLDDYGIGPKQINEVFEGSGLFGDGAALAAGDWRLPEPAWLEDNYFHGASADDWADQLTELVAERSAAPLPALPRRHNRTGGALRRAFERKRMLGSYDRSLLGGASMLVAIPSRTALRAARRLRSRLTGQAPADPSQPVAEARATARAAR